MSNSMSFTQHAGRFAVSAIMLLASQMIAPSPSVAAPTDLADAPLANVSSVQVKPNILFTLDDSGSMNWEYMPDDLQSRTNTVGLRNHMCNTVYYNPDITYDTPVDSDGDPINSTAAASPGNCASATSFSSAHNEGFRCYISGGDTTTTNLASSFRALIKDDIWTYTSDAAQSAYYWKHLGSGTLEPLSSTCDMTLSGTADSTTTEICTDGSRQTSTTCAAVGKSALWRKIIVSSTSGPGATDERQNFANWYSYYRRRLTMMKSASGKAFVPVTDAYRVGFITINPNSPVSSSKFLAVNDFGTTQKSDWFNKLYSQTSNGSTPLRTALSRAGRYFAHKTDAINDGISSDPIQYSCQQNFSILTTDGYWNGTGGYKLDGATSMDNQDGVLSELDAYNPVSSKFQVSPRPIFDGSQTIYAYHELRKYFRIVDTGCSGSRKKRQYRYEDYVTNYPGPGQSGTIVGTPSVVSSTSWTNDSSCSNTPSTYALPSPNPQYITGATPSGASSLTACSTWPCELTTTSGGSSNSLADVAQYYYKTDLRASTFGNCTGAATVDVCNNEVPKSGTGLEDDLASWQHMTTFTMGLGLSGTLAYSPTYKTDTTGTFMNIRSGSANWPAPSSNDPTALDDLWHAGVNGRGQYFSASDPDSVVSGLSSALAGINAKTGAAAAAATSNLEPVAGDNFIYIPKYITQEWTGELEAHEINLSDGSVSATTVWSARDKLDLRTYSYTDTSTTPSTVTSCDTRTIKLFRAGATNNLVDFKWNTDTCNASNLPSGSPQTTLNSSEQAYFDSTEVALLSQSSTMTDGSSGTANQLSAAAGANLVNFLRGHRAKEGYVSNDINKLYRTREHVLGDVVNAKPLHVKAPFAEYDDAGYAEFKASNATRTPMIYVAANDGMLHAFKAGTSLVDSDGGVEAWAVIPTMVLPNLYKLADEDYATLHNYYVDGAPVGADVFDKTASTDCALPTPSAPQYCWKTIIVGGLNKGGKGYYALDVTDPATPKALWEFKYSGTCYNSADSTTWNADCHLGYTFGNPIVSKLSDGTWAVFVTSGYNNVSATPGDGQGYLYVLNAITGKIIYKIATSAGSSTTPSGLGRINGWTDNGIRNNLIQRIYGGDMLGNIWRFDVNDLISPSGREASLMAQVVDSASNPQPITTRPQLAENELGEPVVFVGTGRYLGGSDQSSTQTQSVWAIRDPITSTVTSLRSTLANLVITNVGSGSSIYRTIACVSNCGAPEGWFVDLPDTGERVNIDPQLQLGTLAVATNVPTGSVCNPSGYGWLLYFNYTTGLAAATAGDQSLGSHAQGSDGSEAQIVGFNVVRLPSGTTKVICVDSDGNVCGDDFESPPATPQGRRVGWREIAQ